MAHSRYLAGSYWKCQGSVFHFNHESKSSQSSCIVVGKVSGHGCYLAPYGDFKIDEDCPTNFQDAMFRFTLIRPDDTMPDFQNDFDNCTALVKTIMTIYPEIKSPEPFLSCGKEGPSLNFTHMVFSDVRRISALMTIKFDAQFLNLLYRSHENVGLSIIFR